jgi:hypothetical protein
MVDVVRVKPREQVVVSRRDEFLQPKEEIPLQISCRWRGLLYHGQPKVARSASHPQEPLKVADRVAATGAQR